MIETVIASIMSFAGTNIDDIFIDTLFFAQADTKRKVWSVMIGKYLGIGFLVLLSLLGAFFLQSVPKEYIGFLGLVPIALGIKEWIGYLRSRRRATTDDLEEKQDISRGFLWSVVLITISNGADNIGVYMPLFAGYTVFQMIIVIIVFAVMIALWCLLGKKLSDLPGVRDFLLRYKYLIVPIVFILLGIYIMIEAMC